MDSLFNIAQVPFSAFGSWISLSIPKGEEDLYFRNHTAGAITCSRCGSSPVVKSLNPG